MSPAKLRDVADQIDMQIDLMQAYIHRKTGEIVLAEERVLSALEDGDVPKPEYGGEEAIADARRVLETPDFIELPSQRALDGYGIMASFCRSLEDDRSRELLELAITGKGAFRRFKDTVHRCGLEKSWYAFYDDAAKAFAREFLEENEIPYEE